MDFMMSFLETLGTIAFAVSGAIEAMKKQMDLLGVIVLGMVTAIGGGVIRDIVTGEIPPIAFQNPTQAKVAIVVSIVVFFLAMFLTRHDILTNVSWANAVLFISDAMCLAAFTILGIRFVQERIGNDNFALLLFVGVITGVGGGLLRDIFAGNVPYIFRKHIYATASIFGALMYLWLDKILSELWAVFFSMVCIIVVRILASHFKWNLPRVEILEKAK